MLFVDTRRPGVGVHVDQALRDRVGEEDDDQRGERDQRRAVDRAEQDEDEQHGGEQQLGVDVAEDLLRVRAEAEVAGDVDLHVTGVLVRDVAHRLPPVALLVEVGGRGQHHRRHGPVLGDQGRRGARGERDRGRLRPGGSCRCRQPGSPSRRRRSSACPPRSARPSSCRRRARCRSGPGGSSCSRSRTTFVDSALEGRKDSVESVVLIRQLRAKLAEKTAKIAISQTARIDPLRASDPRLSMPDFSTDLHVGDFFLLRPAFPLNRTQRQISRETIGSVRRRAGLRPCVEGNHG